MNQRLLWSVCIGILLYILIRVKRRMLQKRRNVVIVSTEGTASENSEPRLDPLAVALARRFLQCSDCVVMSVVSARSQLALASALRLRCFASFRSVVCDTASGQGLQELTAKALDFFGGHRIDIWVNSTADMHLCKQHVHPFVRTALATRAALRAVAQTYFGPKDVPTQIFNVLPRCCGVCGRFSTCEPQCALVKEKIKTFCKRVTREERGNKKKSCCHAVDAGVIATKYLFSDGKYYSYKRYVLFSFASLALLHLSLVHLERCHCDIVDCAIT